MVQTQLENIEAAFVAFITAVTGLPVVNERNPGPRPDTPFVSMLMATEEGTDWPYHEYVDPPLTLNETVTDPTYLTLQLAAYGKGSQAALNQVRLMIRSAGFTAPVYDPTTHALTGYTNPLFDLMALFGLGGCSPVNNTTTEFNARRLEQAAMSISGYALLSQDMQPADFFTSDTVEVDINVASPPVPAPEPLAGTHPVETVTQTVTATDDEFVITIGQVPN